MGTPASMLFRACAGDDGEYSHSKNLRENIAIGSAYLTDDSTTSPESRKRDLRVYFELRTDAAEALKGVIW
jgi:hypothetical protein